MFTINQISKTFEKKQAIADLSLKLEEGRIFGMLGTNGAGKSTLLRVMSGILQADHGSVQLDELPVHENPAAKQEICYLSDEPTFLPNATIAEMGRMQAAYYPSYDAEMSASAVSLKVRRNGRRFVWGLHSIPAFFCAMKPSTVLIL